MEHRPVKHGGPKELQRFNFYKKVLLTTVHLPNMHHFIATFLLEQPRAGTYYVLALHAVHMSRISNRMVREKLGRIEWK